MLRVYDQNQEFDLSLHLFKQEDESNAAFFIDNNYRVNYVRFDNSGHVISRRNLFSKLLIYEIKISKLREYYAILLQIGSESQGCNFQNKWLLNEDGSIRDYLALIADLDLNYVTHKPFDYMPKHVAANSFNFLYVDDSNLLFLCDKNLEIVQKVGSKNIKIGTSKTILNIEMNDNHLFILWNNKKLRVHDLKTIRSVKEINVDAHQIKLVSTDYLALFNSTSRMMFFYDQDKDFDFEVEVNLAKEIDANLTLVQDKTKKFTFFSKTKMKCINFNFIQSFSV
jgi:hypothetical protein